MTDTTKPMREIHVQSGAEPEYLITVGGQRLELTAAEARQLYIKMRGFESNVAGETEELLMQARHDALSMIDDTLEPLRAMGKSR